MIIPGRGTAPSVPVVIPIPSRRKTTYHSSLSEHGTNADFLEFVMPLRDEKTFTDEEWVAAFAIILPVERAREEGLAWNSLPDLKGFEDATPEEIQAAAVTGPRSYD
jgi:hypothetical protein